MTNKQMICKRVEGMRTWMRMQNKPFWAIVIPMMDPHESEYLAEHWQVIRWLTGFTGSAGLAVLTRQDALLWTDSRYWLQAEEQLADTPFRLMREGVDDELSWWLHKNYMGLGVIGFSRDMMSPTLYSELNSVVGRGKLVALPSDFVDSFWDDRPPLPNTPLEIVPESLTGESASYRLERLVNYLSIRGGITFFLYDLSEICWLLNIRAHDIPYNPYPVCFLRIRSSRKHTLYVNDQALTPEVKSYLASLKVSVKPYDAGLIVRISSWKQSDVVNPIPEWRAQKTLTEQEGFRRAHLHDGVAMVRFLRRLEESGGEGWTELSAARLLESLRREGEGFLDLSFETISAYGPHGAIVHYEPTEETDLPLTPAKGQQGGELLLIDSGAHYDCGTTDITRTVALGKPTDEERRVYTLVLKGHLKLMNMHFPEGTNGLQLDTAARMDMWREGYDFGHGTGHGVGFRSGVHEGPAQIRKDKRRCTEVAFKPGQVITDEPGIYVAGRFGVRIENMLICQEAEQTEFGNFLCFENLTLCPYDRRLIDADLLTAEDCHWIDGYHRSVCEKLLPLLSDPADRQWLEEATRPLNQ